jgi:hypothetical protein
MGVAACDAKMLQLSAPLHFNYAEVQDELQAKGAASVPCV